MALMKYETKITLYNSYFDINERLSIKSILNIFQDVASIHAEEIGVGYMEMLDKNLYWVLSRIKLDIVKMPKINQTVIVETWPHEKGRIDFDRDLKISSEDGEVLIIGTSKWCVINSVTRNLERSDNVNYIGQYCMDVNYEDKFNKINVPAMELKPCFVYTVMFSDLDHNKHMNNTNYANLVMSVVKNKNISHFEINFLNECLLGDKIELSRVEYAGEYVIGKTDDKICFISYIK